MAILVYSNELKYLIPQAYTQFSLENHLKAAMSVNRWMDNTPHITLSALELVFNSKFTLAWALMEGGRSCQEPAFCGVQEFFR